MTEELAGNPYRTDGSEAPSVRAGRFTTCDVLVVGAGIVGLTIAREIRLRWPNRSVTVLEKETDVAQHASGRNSGVLHAGFYYEPGSLKAKLTNLGNHQMHQFCDERGIKVNRCGKLVVTTSRDQLPTLEKLYQHGTANDVPLQIVTESEVHDIEPRVHTLEKAIYSPNTSSVDPVLVTRKMAEECETLGVSLLTGEAFVSGEEQQKSVKIATTRRVINAGILINAAGLYADRIAHVFGVGKNLQLQPFKGLYLNANETFGPLHTHVYPVPDLRNPFLGVHFTLTVDGHVKIGPTATPALWREQYSWRDRFALSEFAETTSTLFEIMAKPSSTIRKSAISEIMKYSKTLLVKQAARLVPGITVQQFQRWGRPGIRAQLVERSTKRLVNDFTIEKTRHTIHVLNAVSPAFTSSLPFASLIADELDRPS